MSTKEDRRNEGAGAKGGLFERLPDNIPFAPLVRRPDYQIRRVKITVPTSIPTSLVITLVLLGVFFVLAGGFASATQDELNAYGTDVFENPVTFYPEGLDHQFLYEGIAAGTLIFIGVFGFYLMHHATRYAYSPKHATISLVVGIGLVIAPIFPIMYMLIVKLDLLKYLFPNLV